MTEYKVAKIYKMINSVNDIIYIDSTTSTLFEEFMYHKNVTRNLTAFYVAMREIGIEHSSIVLIDELKYITRNEVIEKKNEIINKYLSDHPTKNRGELLYNL